MKRILTYKIYKNDRGNSITLNFKTKEEEKTFLQSFLSEPLEALSWNGKELYGHGKIPYSATIG